jgi:hypothetical protein
MDVIREVCGERQGSSKFFYQNFKIYKVDKLDNDNKTAFECAERRKFGCPASVILWKGNGEITYRRLHNHNPTPGCFETATLKRRLIDKVITERDKSAKQLYNEVITASE